jgi:serine/threonine-protein kinase
MAEDVFGIVGATVAGNFHVERVVAEGGFGVVYRAQHGGFRAPVAIKVLKIPPTMTPEQRRTFLEKFSEEAEMLFRLSAMIPEVVRPLHVDVLQQADGNVAPFLALEWLEGEPFDQILAQRRASGQPLGMHKLVKMLRPIAHALARAHHFPGPDGPVSIIHRDLKPENIFLAVVNGIEKVKILDFGIARTKSVATQMAGRVTSNEGLNAFTPAYGAPEQWVPKRYGQTGPWTDVWGLAITMVEALCGHTPIDGEIPAMMGTVLDEHRRPTPRAEGATVSDDVEKVFERALAVDPRGRTKDVETFWTELEAALGMSSSFGARDARRDPTQPLASEPPDARLSEAPAARPSVEPAPGRVATPIAEIPALDLRRTPPSAPEPAQVVLLGPGVAPQAAAVTQRAPTLRSGAEAELAPRVPTLLPNPQAQVPAAAPASQPRPSQRQPQLPKPTLGVPGALDPFEDVEPLGAELDLARNRPNGPPLEAARGAGRPPAPYVQPVPFDVAPSSRRRPPVAARPEPARPASTSTEDMAELRDRLRLPLTIVGLAVLIAVVDVAVANLSGQLLRIQGIRPLWIAAPLAVLGVALAFWRLLGDRDDA